MKKSKRILVIADFKDEDPKSIHVSQRMWVKGLTRLGHDVQRFSYRNIMMQLSPFASKNFGRQRGKRKADECLLRHVKAYHPDIVFVLSMKYIDEVSLRLIREAAPDAIFVSRDDDPYPDKNPDRIAIAKETDIILLTSAGDFLNVYKAAGIPKCAFVPNMCDPDIQYRYDVGSQWKTDLIFTGKPEHTRLDRDNVRFDLVERFSKLPNMRIYGAFGIPRVEGLDYFYALCGAKIGLSINIANDERLYHSDRLINYLSCGLFTLAKRVPDSDLMFEDGVHLKYFDSADEFFELAKWYLENDTERESIALAGMHHAHQNFNCVTIAQLMLDVIENGTYDAPWAGVA